MHSIQGSMHCDDDPTKLIAEFTVDGRPNVFTTRCYPAIQRFSTNATLEYADKDDLVGHRHCTGQLAPDECTIYLDNGATIRAGLDEPGIDPCDFNGNGMWMQHTV